MPALSRIVLTLVAALAISGSSLLRAEDGPRERPARSGATGAVRPENLEKTMENMQRTFDALNKQVKDKTQVASSLTLVTDMERLVLTAKGIIPGRISRLEGDARDKAKTTYQTMLLGVLRELLSTEEQLLEGKTDEAAETLAGIKQIEEEGHKEFKVKKD